MSNLSDLIDRAKHCRESGSFDSLHGELLEMVEFLGSEFDTERDRANEHFEARMTAEAENRDLRAQLDLARGGVHVRPMTDSESNLMTQVLDLRRRNGELLAALNLIGEIVANRIQDLSGQPSANDNQPPPGITWTTTHQPALGKGVDA